jgi:3'-phosphoadenosine 5'-phosphosulfate sulfotransferase (PAPS reductase)/FAD synthetase
MKILVSQIPQHLVEQGALFVVSHSGGKDSQAMLIKLLEVIPKPQLLVVHASLGEMEWPGALEHAQQQAEAAGLPFIVARAQKSLLDMVEHRFATRPEVPSWPSPSTRQCTSDLKRGPIEREVRRYVAEHGFKIVVSCMGLRAHESPDRAKRDVLRHNARNSVAGRDWWDWLPIHGMMTDEVFATIWEAGQKPHPAYANGNERLSCVFCIMASKADLINGAKRNPELYARYRALEQKTGYTMHASRKPLQDIVGDLP